MFKKIDHIEIVTGNMERTLKFYTEILGFEIQTRRKGRTPPREEVASIELGGTLIELFSVKNPAPPASTEQWQIGKRRIAIEVDDLDKAIEYLKSKGVEIVGSREIKDPDGLSIELLQRG